MIYLNTELNRARNIAFKTLQATISENKNLNTVSEIDFQKKWLHRMRETKDIIADGWYCPPPMGMAVLTGDIDYPSRTSFDSLRSEINWPSDDLINWEKNLLYVYCSPVDIKTGLPGDIAVTLYFGDNILVKEHFRNTYKATQEVIKTLDIIRNSRELFMLSQEIFAQYGLKNCVISKTDQTPLDLGHTLPRLKKFIGQDLLEEQKVEISKSRRFINGESSWNFQDGMQFTIEPQLISLSDNDMPQVSYHYIVEKRNNNFILCNDVDILIDEYQLK